MDPHFDCVSVLAWALWKQAWDQLDKLHKQSYYDQAEVVRDMVVNKRRKTLLAIEDGIPEAIADCESEAIQILIIDIE